MDVYSDSNFSVLNNTHNSEDDFIKTPAVIATAVSITDAVLIIFGAPINLVVMITIARHYHKLKVMDLFILNLCLSDFISSIFYQPLVITRLLADSKLNNMHTRVLKMASFTCLLADCAALFLVTFDKYLGIRFPYRYHMYMNKQKVVAITISTWIMAITIGLTFAIGESGMIAGILYSLLLVIMFIITTSFQIASFIIAKRHQRRIHQMETGVVKYNSTEKRKERNDENSTGEQIELPQIVKSTTKTHTPIRPLASKAARTITLLTTVFIMSWFPQIVLNVYFMITFDRKTFFSLIFLLVTFQQVHVCINPFIYVFRTKSIRSKFFGGRNEISSFSAT